jgi:hypothetical protein
VTGYVICKAIAKSSSFGYIATATIFAENIDTCGIGWRIRRQADANDGLCFS